MSQLKNALRMGAPSAALQAVLYERDRQDEQWGGAGHDDSHPISMWLSILMKHVGRLAEQDLEYGRWNERYEQAVKIAAVSLAMVEALGRRTGDAPAAKGESE